MVICKFFQQGNCRFGSKCNNDHIDLKQLVKADIEASINGKQWPFSCYGPFKDKPCLRNFIDDQSFEEVRLMCYEAKQKNFFEQFHRQFNTVALEANAKMKALLQFTPDVMNMIIATYESPTSTLKTDVLKSSNPFDLNSASGQSILNKTNTMNTNIFGLNSNNKEIRSTTGFGSNPFTMNTANLNQGSTGNFFGSSSVFGQNKDHQIQQQPSQQTSIFGQAFNKNTSLFSTTTGTNNTMGQSPFSMCNQTPNLNGNNIFGQVQSQQSQQQLQQQQQPNTNTFGLFNQSAATNNAPQQQLLNQSNVFGSISNPSSTNSTNQNLFNQASNVQQQTYSIFNQTNQQQMAITNQNLFAQRVQTSNTVFDMKPPTIEQQLLQQQQQQQQQLQQQQQQQSALNTFTFQQNAPQQSQTNQRTLYSRLDELTTDEIEAFKSNEFQPGALPCKPPPKELIN